MKITRKKLIISICVAVLLLGMFILVIIDGPEEIAKKKASPVQSEEKPPVQVEIPPHRDNEEDKQPEVIQETKEIAETFAKKYITLLPKNREKFLEQVQPYTEKQLYHYLSFQVPEDEGVKRRVIELQSTPLDDILENRKKWQLIAFVEVKTEGRKKALEKQMYFQINVALKNGKWIVTGYEVNE